MPYQIAIPDVCDGHNCSITEAAELVAMATKKPISEIKLPTPFNRRMTFVSEEGEILAQAILHTSIWEGKEEETDF